VLTVPASPISSLYPHPLTAEVMPVKAISITNAPTSKVDVFPRLGDVSTDFCAQFGSRP
jgi:hypothetical protein